MLPIELRPSKAVAIGVALLGLVSLGLGGGLATDGRPLLVVLGVVLGAMGLLMAVAGAAPLWPGAASLRLSDEGITVKWLKRHSCYRWTDIERFGLRREGRNSWVVAMRLRPQHPEHTREDQSEFHASVGGGWQLGQTALKALMEEHHRQAMARSTATSPDAPALPGHGRLTAHD
jgi:hypothetical protein